MSLEVGFKSLCCYIISTLLSLFLACSWRCNLSFRLLPPSLLLCPHPPRMTEPGAKVNVSISKLLLVFNHSIREVINKFWSKVSFPGAKLAFLLSELPDPQPFHMWAFLRHELQLEQSHKQTLKSLLLLLALELQVSGVWVLPAKKDDRFGQKWSW